MTIMMLLYVSLLFKRGLFIILRDIIFNLSIARRNFQQTFNPNCINFEAFQGFMPLIGLIFVIRERFGARTLRKSSEKEEVTRLNTKFIQLET
jgi:hypothetical protein